jgi:hypothetical protein
MVFSNQVEKGCAEGFPPTISVSHTPCFIGLFGLFRVKMTLFAADLAVFDPHHTPTPQN